MTTIELNGFTFKRICRIVPELDENNKPIEYAPQNEYKNTRRLPLNKYGSGTFCRFRIPNGITETGVYAVLVNGEVKYIGECDSLSSRWNVGYGNISPRNCFLGGQSTNCRINKLVLETCKLGENIDLYFHQSENRSQIEGKLIEALSACWNIKRNGDGSSRGSRAGRNKYHALTDYLLKSKKPIEHLTFAEIERILKSKLPMSAYNFSAWWSDTGHQHAETWTKAGFRATSLKLGKSVTFRKSSR